MHDLFGNCEIPIPQYYELMLYIELVDAEETVQVEKPKWNCLLLKWEKKVWNRFFLFIQCKKYCLSGIRLSGNFA